LIVCEAIAHPADEVLDDVLVIRLDGYLAGGHRSEKPDFSVVVFEQIEDVGESLESLCWML
jgi:hypothetical protein